MKSINAGLFHDSSGELLSLLGKKGTMTDIQFSNRKEGDTFYAFLEPREDKLSAKCQIIQTMDIAILCINQITPEVGETILILDAMKKNLGVMILSDTVDKEMLSKITKDTVVSGYGEVGRDFNQIIEALNSFEITRNDSLKKVIEVDQFFNVKGVGTVILGFVKQGTINKFDKLKMLPGGKEIVVRSIQMHDKDFDSANDGCRVGLALKGVEAEEFTKGTLLCEEGTAELATEVKIEFEKNKFFSGAVEAGKIFHVSHGMQFPPLAIKSIDGNKIVLESKGKVVIRKNQRVILIDLNAPKLHLVGSGNFI